MTLRKILLGPVKKAPCSYKFNMDICVRDFQPKTEEQQNANPMIFMKFICVILCRRMSAAMLLLTSLTNRATFEINREVSINLVLVPMHEIRIAW